MTAQNNLPDRMAQLLLDADHLASDLFAAREAAAPEDKWAYRYPLRAVEQCIFILRKARA